MKKIALLAASLLVTLSAFAQDETSTAWPYLYPEFREGTIYMAGGNTIVHTMNVHTLHGRLHYIDNGVVKEAMATDILVVRIGDEKYMYVEGNLTKVLAENPDGFVSALILGDFASLSEAGGAYGSSTSASATRKLSSIEVSGRVNQNHMEMWQSRHDGQTCSLVYTYYITCAGKVYKATKKDIEYSFDDSRKAEFKAFLKTHKIKWKDAASLLELTEFLK